MRRLLCLALVPSCGLVLWLATSCISRPAPNGMPCADHGDCAAEGEGQFGACVDGYCSEVECLVSTDCPRGTFCDAQGQDYTCDEGCLEDNDCLAGQVCDEDNTCQQAPCRSTILDCNFGEICNLGTGACQVAQGNYCDSCDPLLHESTDQHTLDQCDDRILGHPECGGTGSFCLGGEGTGIEAYCAVQCLEAADCPAGYQCAPITMSLSSPPCSESSAFLGQACVANACP